MKQSSSFPDGFLWGASTAAHQVEGNTHNQWSEWELANAGRLAATFTQRLGWLPNLAEITPAGTDPANYISGPGVEHYERFREDFDILQQLNLHAFRFSVEWSRLEPEEGKWNEEAIAHYRQYIAELKKRGIEPVLTLWHWTMPLWFVQKGGFSRRKNIAYFVRFARKALELYGDDLTYVITLNEPNVYTMLSYGLGEWPPQGKNPLRALRVYANLMLAHRQVYRTLKRVRPHVHVGIAMAMSNGVVRNRRNVADVALVRMVSYFWNYWFIDRIKRDQDFIGINYYATNYWSGLRRHHPKLPKSDLGWSMEPKMLENVLVETWQRYGIPLMVTENGLADAHDAHRKWWLEESIAAMERAIARGVKLRGYLHWSLVDNFEWAYGWWPKFGLVAVDRATMKRTIRPSARWFADKIRDL